MTIFLSYQTSLYDDFHFLAYNGFFLQFFRPLVAGVKRKKLGKKGREWHFFWQKNKYKVKINREVQFLACTSVLASMPTTKKFITLAQKMKPQCQNIDGLLPTQTVVFSLNLISRQSYLHWTFLSSPSHCLTVVKILIEPVTPVMAVIPKETFKPLQRRHGLGRKEMGALR